MNDTSILKTGGKFKIFIKLLIAVCMIGCAPQISHFSPIAYEQATSLKVDSLVLMGKAAESYTDHEEEISGLMNRVEKSYEYAKGRPHNEYSARQWEILKDPDRNLLGGFMKRWEDQGKLSPTFINEAKRLISDAYDTIIGLESRKIKPPKE